MGSYIETNQIDSKRKLRRRAEDRLDVETENSVQINSETETERLLHELQVHQIELEMQNIELQQASVDVENSLNKYTDLYEFAPVGYFTLDGEGVVRDVNLTCCGLFGIDRTRLLGRRLEQLVSAADRDVFKSYITKISESRTKDTCDLVMLKEGRHPFYVQIKAVMTPEKEFRLALIDISEQVLLRIELATKVKQLEDALSMVKQLVGMIPICSYCHKIRDEKQIWNQMEKYISEHSEAKFTHGVCPDCFDKLTKELKSETQELMPPTS